MLGKCEARGFESEGMNREGLVAVRGPSQGWAIKAFN